MSICYKIYALLDLKKSSRKASFFLTKRIQTSNSILKLNLTLIKFVKQKERIAMIFLFNLYGVKSHMLF